MNKFGSGIRGEKFGSGIRDKHFGSATLLTGNSAFMSLMVLGKNVQLTPDFLFYLNQLSMSTKM
jgi:hypothetical protein